MGVRWVAMAASRMGTFEWDLRTHRGEMSPELEAIHGLAPGEFDGSREMMIELVHATTARSSSPGSRGRLAHGVRRLRISVMGSGAGSLTLGGPMITLTTEATDVIREMVGNAELPDTGGLRLDMSDGTLNSAPPSLALTLVETPATGDEVIDEGDVHVYVSREAAPLLDGKELDARTEPGGVTFLVNDR